MDKGRAGTYLNIKYHAALLLDEVFLCITNPAENSTDIKFKTRNFGLLKNCHWQKHAAQIMNNYPWLAQYLQGIPLHTWSLWCFKRFQNRTRNEKFWKSEVCDSEFNVGWNFCRMGMYFFDLVLLSFLSSLKTIVILPLQGRWLWGMLILLQQLLNPTNCLYGGNSSTKNQSTILFCLRFWLEPTTKTFWEISIQEGEFPKLNS